MSSADNPGSGFKYESQFEDTRADVPNEGFDFQSRCTLSGKLHKAGSDEQQISSLIKE